MFEPISNSWFSFDKRLYFLLLCMMTMLLMVLGKEVLLDESLYYEAYADQLSRLDITRSLDFQKEWEWVIYVLIPLIFLFKMALVACCLSVGAFIYEWEFSFSRFFKIALVSETVFLWPAVFKMIWFGWVQSDFSLSDLMDFYPLSLQNLISLEDGYSWLLYPLQVSNIFELVYMVALATGTHLSMKRPFARSLSLVVVYYGAGLIIWVTLITFLTLLVGT